MNDVMPMLEQIRLTGVSVKALLNIELAKLSKILEEMNTSISELKDEKFSKGKGGSAIVVEDGAEIELISNSPETVIESGKGGIGGDGGTALHIGKDVKVKIIMNGGTIKGGDAGQA
ncbi:hypothetical protein R50073_21320 [Maricurvus nonylphenolicus]|uniref:hypothetical protein n=1 Tax=Maricurvus nonylphenolicus TaxID=1008307 RepID=UPI0036F3D918